MSEEKLHVCGECQKDFKKLHKLKAHMSSHLFKCAKCEKMFYKRIYLKRHGEIHKGNVFQCDQCDFKTLMKSIFRDIVKYIRKVYFTVIYVIFKPQGQFILQDITILTPKKKHINVESVKSHLLSLTA